MNDTRHRRATAVVDIGHRAGDSTRSRNTAEERHHDVRYTLRNELRVRVMLIADHAVRYHRGEERFNSTEHGDREGGREEFLNERKERFAIRQFQSRQVRSRDTMRQSVQVADGLQTRDTP